MHAHSPAEMLSLLLIMTDWRTEVESGEQPLMIIVRDNGIKDRDSRFKPMFNVKEALRASTKRSSFRASAFGL